MRQGTTAVVAPASGRLVKRAMLTRAVLGSAVAAVVAIGIAGRAVGAPVTWTGATNNDFNLGTNWDTAAPTSADDAFLTSPAASNLDMSLTAPLTIRTLTFTADAPGSVTVRTTHTNRLTFANLAGNNILVLGGSHSIAASDNVSPNIDIKTGTNATTFTVNVASGASLDLNGRLSQGNSGQQFRKVGEGTLTLSANNGGGTGWNVTGASAGVFVDAGTLVIANSGAAGNSSNRVIVAGGATLELRQNWSATANTSTLNDGATLRTYGTRSWGNAAGSLAVNGLATIDVVDAQFTLSQDLTGAGGFVKTGAGLMILADGAAGVNSYTGTTAVAAGTLRLAAGASIASSRVVDVRAGATLDTTVAGGLAVASGQSLGGAGHVMGNVTAGAGSTVAPGLAGAVGTLTFDNDLTLSGGALAVDLSNPAVPGEGIAVTGALGVTAPSFVNVNRIAGAVAGGTYTIATYGSLATDAATTAANLQLPQVRQGITLVNPSTTPGSLQIQVGAGSAGSLAWRGNVNGMWDRTTANFTNGGSPDTFFDWDGVAFDDTAVSTTIDVAGVLTPGNLTFNNAAKNFTLAGSGTLNDVPGLTKDGAGSLVLGVANGTFGSIAVNAGTLTLANANAYAVGSLTNAAALNIGDGTSGGLGVVGGGTTVQNTGTVAYNRPDEFTMAGAISGAGSVVKKAGGTAVVTGANTYTGDTTVEAGVLRVTTSASLGNAALANGPVGSVTVQNGAVLELAGAAANGIDLRAHAVTVSGAGTGQGAIVNNTAVNQQNAFQNVTLAGNTTIGGSGRFDIRAASGLGSLNLGSHTLTKTGAGQFTLVAVDVTGNGNINVSEGIFSVETTTNLTSTGTLSAGPGTTVMFFRPAGGTITMPMRLDGALVTDGNQANVVTNVNSPITLASNGTFQVNNSAGFTFGGDVSSADASPKDVTVQKTGTATSVMAFGGANVDYRGATFLNNSGGAGTLTLQVGTASTVRTSTLGIDGGSRLDLVSGARMVLTGTTVGNVVGSLQVGRNGGAWDGVGGIMTSSGLAAADPGRTRSIGWAVAGEIGLTGGAWGSMAGLSATDILLKSTYYGDLNLDGQVGGDDYALLDRHVARNGMESAGRWVDGDVNYDGVVGVADFMLTDTAYGLQTGVLSPGLLAARSAQFGEGYVQALVAAVPEPSMMGGLVIAALPAVARRRRK